MNCQSCKNPITKNSTICEWCGAILSTDAIISDNVFTVLDTYKILFQGKVLVGKFEKPISISKGEEFVYKQNGILSKAIIKSIEYNKEMIDTYYGNELIGILI